LILDFKDLFSSSSSLLSFTFSLNRSTRPLYFSLSCLCSLLNFLYSLAISVLIRFLTCCFNLSLSLAAVTKFLSSRSDITTFLVGFFLFSLFLFLNQTWTFHPLALQHFSCAVSLVLLNQIYLYRYKQSYHIF